MKPKVKICFETWGQKGDWLTLVTGTSRTLNDFRGMARLFQSTFRLLSMDNRGAGQTEEKGPFTLKDTAGDLLSLWEELKIEKSHLLGISYGGAICLAGAEAFGQRLKSLTLVSTSARSPWITNLQGQRGFEEYFSERFLKENPLMARAVMKELEKVFKDPGRAKKVAQQRAALANYDYLSLLANLKIPVHILHGEQDKIIPADAAWEMAKAAPQAQIEIFPHVGHLLLVEMPKLFYNRVEGFLKRT